MHFPTNPVIDISNSSLSDSDYEVFTNKRQSQSQLRNSNQVQAQRAEHKSRSAVVHPAANGENDEEEVEDWKLERQRFKESMRRLSAKHEPEPVALKVLEQEEKEEP